MEVTAAAISMEALHARHWSAAFQRCFPTTAQPLPVGLHSKRGHILLGLSSELSPLATKEKSKSINTTLGSSCFAYLLNIGISQNSVLESPPSPVLETNLGSMDSELYIQSCRVLLVNVLGALARWLLGRSIVLYTKRVQVPFPVRECIGGNWSRFLTSMFLSLFPSLSLSLSRSQINKNISDEH